MRFWTHLCLFMLLALALTALGQEPSKNPDEVNPPDTEDPFNLDEEGPSANQKATTRIDDWRLDPTQVRAERVQGRMGATRVGSLNDVPYILRPSRPFYQRYGQGRLLTPLDSDITGFKFGALTIYPMGDVSATYNDKVLGEESDVLLKYAPGVALTYQPTRQLTIDAGYTFTWNDYVDDQVKDFLEHDANIAFTIRDAGVNDLMFRIYDNYGQTANVGQFAREVQFQLDNSSFQSFSLTQSYLAFERLQNNNAGVLATYNTGKIFMEANYEYDTTDYFSARANPNDSRTHSARGSVAFEHYKQFRPFIAYQYEWIMPTNVGSAGSEAHTFTVGTTIAITHNLNSYINISPRTVNNLDSHLHYEDMTIDSGLIWQATKKVNLVFNGDGGIRDRENGPSSRLLGCGVTMTANIIKDLDFGAFASFRNIENETGSTSQTNIYGVRVDYRIHHYLRMYGLFNRGDAWNDSGIGSVQHGSQNIGTIGFSARF